MSRRSAARVRLAHRCRARRVAAAGVALAAVLVSPSLHAQVVPGAGAAIGSMAADRARLAQLGAPAEDTLATQRDGTTPGALHLVLPTVFLSLNSSLPDGGNDGALWAGRGINLSATGGIALSRTIREHVVDIALLPSVTYSQNLRFSVFPGREPGRSPYSSPWHIGDVSADLPLRFGDRSLVAVGLGQSAVTIHAADVDFGASAANEWWGPGIRNTLLLSDNAAGVPRLFVRTARPIRTGAGSIEARAFIGALTESPFFDYVSENDTRSLSGVLVTFRPAGDSALTIGLSRAVMAPVSSPGEVLLHVLDFVLPRPGMDDSTNVNVSRPSTDAITSLFARWVFPASGFEAYAEWARTALPRSLREALETPGGTQGYTLGLQWVSTPEAGRFVRLQGEVTDLEQTQVRADQPVRDFYTSRASPQGFTQRGQILGAQVGPGGSTQFLAVDLMRPRWNGGVFVGRTRTENDALYRQPDASLVRHDVTIFSGIRGGLRLSRADLSSELTIGRRFDYLFQNKGRLDAPYAIDIENVSMTMRIAPR